MDFLHTHTEDDATGIFQTSTFSNSRKKLDLVLTARFYFSTRQGFHSPTPSMWNWTSDRFPGSPGEKKTEHPYAIFVGAALERSKQKSYIGKP